MATLSELRERWRLAFNDPCECRNCDAKRERALLAYYRARTSQPAP